MNIKDYLPEKEILAQLAEECAELAQAALKLRRALDGTNPTPKSEENCREALREEIADVLLCLSEIEDTWIGRVAYYTNTKRKRWLQRLEARE